MPASSKRWRKLRSSLMMRGGQSSSILPLRSNTGEWILHAEQKANLFAKAFSSKIGLPELVTNAYTDVIDKSTGATSGLLPLRPRHALRFLKGLREDSGTGPDLLPTMILKRCAKTLALPTSIIARLVLTRHHWPRSWKVPWLLRCTNVRLDT